MAHRETVAELESTVVKLQRDLRLMNEAKMDVGVQAGSDDEAGTVSELTADSCVEGTRPQRRDEVDITDIIYLTCLFL